uniref:Uncharacterized protein n=1 Tax=Populus trichocarpa TaxID=3694 RepID=A0A2K1X2N4_POPTR
MQGSIIQVSTVIQQSSPCNWVFKEEPAEHHPRDYGQVKPQLKLELGMTCLDCSPSLGTGSTASNFHF